MALPRTLLADDHPVFMEGLRSLLNTRCEFVGSVTNGVDLLDADRKLRPDFIISDVSMPGLNGIDAVRALRKQETRAKILMLSMHEDKEFALEALHAGADGYVLKSSVFEEIHSAFESTLAGRIYVAQQISRGETFEFEQARRHPAKDLPGLSVREIEVLQLVAEGKSTKQIAGIMGVAARTVFFHKSNVRNKLGVESTAELTRYALRHGLVAHQ